MHFPKKEGDGGEVVQLVPLHLSPSEPYTPDVSLARILAFISTVLSELSAHKMFEALWRGQGWQNLLMSMEARQACERDWRVSGWRQDWKLLLWVWYQEASLETAPPPLGLTKSQGPLKGGRQERTDRSLLAFFMKGGGGVEAKARTRENTLWTGRTIIPHVCPDPPSGLPTVSDGGRCRAPSRVLAALCSHLALAFGPHRLGFLSSPKTFFHPFSAPTLWGGTAHRKHSFPKTSALAVTYLVRLGLEGDLDSPESQKDPALSLRACLSTMTDLCFHNYFVADAHGRRSQNELQLHRRPYFSTDSEGSAGLLEGCQGRDGWRTGARALDPTPVHPEWLQPLFSILSFTCVLLFGKLGFGSKRHLQRAVLGEKYLRTDDHRTDLGS